MFINYNSLFCIIYEKVGTLCFSFVVAICLYYSILFLEWGLHKLGHIHHKYNFIYDIHIEHHKKYYPNGQLLQDAPYKHGNGGYIYGLISVFIGILIYNIFPVTISVPFILISGLFLFISDYLHSHYHIKNSYLEIHLGDWFIKKREYHFKHHERMDKHLSLSGIFTDIDTFFNTY